jgi:hypothetical protein
MVLPHHVGNFLPKTKGFFPHDFTLIASVVGESVIGHGIGGKYIPIYITFLPPFLVRKPVEDPKLPTRLGQSPTMVKSADNSVLSIS